MTDQPAAEADQAKFEISFRDFLEGVHPSVQRGVRDVWHTVRYASGGTSRYITVPPLRLHCDECDGEHWFRGQDIQIGDRSGSSIYVNYTCSDCQKQRKI